MRCWRNHEPLLQGYDFLSVLLRGPVSHPPSSFRLPPTLIAHLSTLLNSPHSQSSSRQPSRSSIEGLVRAGVAPEDLGTHFSRCSLRVVLATIMTRSPESPNSRTYSERVVSSPMRVRKYGIKKKVESKVGTYCWVETLVARKRRRRLFCAGREDGKPRCCECEQSPRLHRLLADLSALSSTVRGDCRYLALLVQ